MLMPRRLECWCLSVCLLACGTGNEGSGNDDGSKSSGGTSSAGASAAGGGVGGGSGGSNATGGKSNGGTAGVSATGGSSGATGSGGSAGSTPIDLPPADGTLGEWEYVTPEGMDLGGFGAGNIVVDPSRPTDLYVGGYGSIWKSTDYGLTWTKLECNPEPPSIALGHVLAVAGTTPPTLWMANVIGDQKVFKSTDGGANFTLTGTLEGDPFDSLYSIKADPTDSDHLISGLHEADGLYESTDGGETWSDVRGEGWPSGGTSWFPFFVDQLDGATPMKSWFAIAQGGSPALTTDGGAHWTQPDDLSGLSHPHGGSNLYQNGENLFVAGIYGPSDGIFRSTDLGDTWTNVSSGYEALVWGTPKNLYSMWGWACSGCTGNDYRTAPQPGTTWTKSDVPVPWGPNSIAVTSDGTHSIMVGSMWMSGLWRYIEP